MLQESSSFLDILLLLLLLRIIIITSVYVCFFLSFVDKIRFKLETSLDD
jgi:hypothetical protein